MPLGGPGPQATATEQRPVSGVVLPPRRDGRAPQAPREQPDGVSTVRRDVTGVMPAISAVVLTVSTAATRFVAGRREQLAGHPCRFAASLSQELPGRSASFVPSDRPGPCPSSGRYVRAAAASRRRGAPAAHPRTPRPAIG